jgi:hypothetical protein
MKTHTLFALTLVATLAACGDKDDDTGTTSESDTDTDTDSDTDTDTDADADADTDTDTDTDLTYDFSEENAANDGSYSGDIAVEVSNGSLTDSCVGTTTFTYDNTNTDGQIDGTGSCSFAGPMAALLNGEYAITLLGGSTDTAGTAAGTFLLVTDVTEINDTWAGTLSGGTFAATVDGEFEFSGMTFTYDGAISATKQ